LFDAAWFQRAGTGTDDRQRALPEFYIKMLTGNERDLRVTENAVIAAVLAFGN
jgi:hypothetical protein